MGTSPASLLKMKQAGDKITALTCYDASMARLLEQEKIDLLLVGDSVGNVKLGYDNTLPVTLEEMLVYTRAVKRGQGPGAHGLLVTDMPFLSYEVSPETALASAGRVIKEGGAGGVKVEGAADHVLAAVKALVKTHIPVLGHVGLTPQAVLKWGGYAVQGKTPGQAEAIVAQAQALEEAGAFALVLEAVPLELGRRVTEAVSIPTIGIGAGPHCDGQILVLDDAVGLSEKPLPKFVRPYGDARSVIRRAVQGYRDEVQSGRFPALENSYN